MICSGKMLSQKQLSIFFQHFYLEVLFKHGNHKSKVVGAINSQFKHKNLHLVFQIFHQVHLIQDQIIIGLCVLIQYTAVCSNVFLRCYSLSIYQYISQQQQQSLSCFISLQHTLIVKTKSIGCLLISQRFDMSVIIFGISNFKIMAMISCASIVM